MRRWWAGVAGLLLLCSCAVQKPYNPAKRYGVKEMQEDFDLFRAILEESHPSLYWYTPKDSMDYYFSAARQKLTDSLPEHKFRYILSYVVSKIRCGHTAVIPSKAAARNQDRLLGLALPFSVKAWPDTVMVTANLRRRDSVITRGAVLRAIDGRPVRSIVDSLFSLLPSDGYNLTHKYQALSNGASFRNLYGAVYGLRPRLKIDFVDTAGRERSTTITVLNPTGDTPQVQLPVPKLSRSERRRLELLSARSLQVDTAGKTAMMVVNTFTTGKGLRSFFRKSFRQLRQLQVNNLIVDLRGNGGGQVTLSNLLTRYIADKPFKIADSLYAIRSRSAYSKYRGEYFLNRLFFIFMTKKKADGYYHFSLYENKFFKPREKDHFNGTTYLLTGGNTFSAAALVAKSLKDQPNVVVVGEETGGSGYGNTAWLIPEVTLPHTGVRFRLPLFRLVIDKDAVKGQSVLPEAEALPNLKDILQNRDYKLEKAKGLIRAAAGGL